MGYDGQSRLTAATAGTHTASFLYDANNRQVSRTVDGVTTYFVWDGWSLLAEYHLRGGIPVQVARYVHGPRFDEILLQQKTTQPSPSYLHEDALGSTYLLTDGTGSAVERYSYTAFGEVTAYDNAGGTVANPSTRFLYTGREWISEVGLNDHRNRFYLPSLGRWLSADPIGERGGLNLYGYIGNDPINGWDPLGLIDMNLLPSVSPEWRFVNSWNEDPGTYDVMGHGDSENMTDSNGDVISAASLANLIKNGKNYKGQDVKLWACNTGGNPEKEGGIPFAQQLANELGKNVTAPTKFLHTRLVPDYKNGGYSHMTLYFQIPNPNVHGGRGFRELHMFNNGKEFNDQFKTFTPQKNGKSSSNAEKCGE
jgi:RHS repeat-associated protein